MKKTDLACYRIGFAFILLVSLCMVAVYLLKPVEDPDFFWHVKTGEWIWHHKCLPQIDPFTLSPPASDNISSRFILTSYWLAQLIIFACYSLGGWSGIILLRLALIVVLTALFASWGRLRDFSVACVLILLAIQLLEFYTLERPQIFSFICFTALLILLDRIVRQQRREPRQMALLCLLMLVWSNLHGGFLVGQVTIALFMIMEGLKFFHPSLQPVSWRKYKKAILIASAALAVSVINPNPVNSFKILAGLGSANGSLSGMIAEYSSAYTMLREAHYTIILNWLFILMTAFTAIMSGRRINITWLAILASTGYMGCVHIRFMPFFLVAATLYLIRHVDMSGIGGTVLRGILALATLAAACFFPINAAYHGKAILRDVGISRRLPIAAADFIVENNVRGPIFNRFEWGGYLLWRLGPDKKIFSDPRQLDPRRYWEVMNSYTDPNRKALFDRYNIQTAILPLRYSTGKTDPIVDSLQDDTEWTLAFKQDNTCVYVRSKKPVVSTSPIKVW